MATPIGIDALWRVKKILKTQQAIADALGISQPSVHEVFARGKRVPAEWCIPLERATERAVTRHQLRPDLYPEEIAGAAA